MLELAGGETLSMNVGQLLELERPLQGHREADVAAEEENRGHVLELEDQLLNLRLLLENLLHAGRHRGELIEIGGHFVSELVAA